MATVHVEPTAEQLEEFMKAAGDPAPVFMLNLLRFKERADGIDEADGISGAEAYARYAAATGEHLQRVGGEVVWAGACGEALIGPPGEWDAAAVVRYPSRGRLPRDGQQPGLPRDRPAPHRRPRRLTPRALRPGPFRRLTANPSAANV